MHMGWRAISRASPRNIHYTGAGKMFYIIIPNLCYYRTKRRYFKTDILSRDRNSSDVMTLMKLMLIMKAAMLLMMILVMMIMMMIMVVVVVVVSVCVLTWSMIYMQVAGEIHSLA